MPTDPRVETLRLLQSIDASLKALVRQSSGSQQGGQVIAADADLDGQYGNPEVRAKDPRDWTGAPMKGRRFSECPADYLDLIANRFDYFAGQEADPKKASYAKKDAARARGWAKRVRDGKVPVAAGAIDGDGWDGGEFPPVGDDGLGNSFY